VQGCHTARRLRATQSSGPTGDVADFSKTVLQGAFVAAARGAFLEPFSGTRRGFFSGAARGPGERAGSRLAVYFVLRTRGEKGAFAFAVGVWRCSAQEICVRRGSSPIGGVDDGKVVGGDGREVGVFACATLVVFFGVLAFP
jgi:hypothetical protein